MVQRFDAIIVGAGQAGPPLAGRLTAAGQTVAVIERKLFGGTCVNYGCIPTKTLVASAHAAHLARRGGEFLTAAELQLFSFCAAGCLGTSERASALNAVDTVERLQCATGARRPLALRPSSRRGSLRPRGPDELSADELIACSSSGSLPAREGGATRGAARPL